MSLTIILTSFIAFFVVLKIWVKMTTGRCTSKRQLNGKTVIVTGANCGIGKETALDLARRGARVILACRNLELGNEALKDIKRETTKGELVVKHLDLSRLSSIRAFADEINREESRLDVLINNAGTGGTKPRKMSKDGIELTYAINYFGPFVLTHLLLDKLKASAPSRIVNVSSYAHFFGNINLDDINGDRQYSPFKVYGDTKLALNMFTHQMAEKLAGTGVTINSLHPGAVNTEIFRRMPDLMRWVTRGILWMFYKSPEEGAQTTLHLAVSEEVEGITGKYFSDCKVAAESTKALDKITARKLWTLSQKLTNLKED